MIALLLNNMAVPPSESYRPEAWAVGLGVALALFVLWLMVRKDKGDE